MNKSTFRVIRVFLAGPSDVTQEKQIASSVINHLNEVLAEPNGYTLRTRDWQNVHPDYGRPQGRINPFVQDCHIFLGIFYKRFGQPTGKAKSGTVEELEIVLNRRRRNEETKIPTIFVYFRDIPKEFREHPDQQLTGVLSLKADLEKKKELLFGTYASLDDFREKFETHLADWLNERINEGWVPDTSEIVKPEPEVVGPTLKLEEVAEIFKIMSSGISNIERGIDGWVYKSDKLQEVIDACLKPESSEGKGILITERPGGGKSVFLAQLYEHISPQLLTLAIQAERYPDLEDALKLPERFGFDFDLVELVRQGLQRVPVVILIDSLDALASGRVHELFGWLRFIDVIRSIEGVTIVCSCRSFDRQYTYPLSATTWGKEVIIGILPLDEIDRFLREGLEVDPQILSQTTREFLRVPLHLKLATQIVRLKGSLEGLSGIHTLYERLMEARSIEGEHLDGLIEIAQRMTEKRQIVLRRRDVKDIEVLEDLERAGLVVGYDPLQFVHKTLMDYLIAFDLIRSRKSLADYLIEKRQNLFLRPVIRHVLQLLHEEPQRLVKELDEIFYERAEQIHAHIKVGILSVMAEWDEPTRVEGQWLLRLFENKEKEQWELQFFAQRPKPGWMNVLLDPYLKPALRGDRNNHRFFRALSFIQSIASAYPKIALELAMPLADGPINREVGWFFGRVSEEVNKVELDSETRRLYANLIEKAVGRGFEMFSFSVVVECSRLAKIDEERALRLYFQVLQQQRRRSWEGTGKFTWQESVGGQFSRLLPKIFKRKPILTLMHCAAFLKSFFCSEYKRCDSVYLWDEPTTMLYGEYAERYDAEAFLDWFFQRVKEVVRNESLSANELTEALIKSRWKTLCHIGYLALLEVPDKHAEALFRKADCIITAAPGDIADRHLLLFILQGAFQSFDDDKRQSLVDAIASIQCKDDEEERYWVYVPLNHIPESLRSSRVNESLTNLKKKHGPYKYSPPIMIGRLEPVLPPIGRGQLADMNGEELYSYLVKNRSLKEIWDAETLKPIDGVHGIAQEFSKLLKENPHRYLPLLRKLAEDKENSVYLQYALGFFDIQENMVEEVIAIAEKTYKWENVQLSLVRTLAKTVQICTEEQWGRLKAVLIFLAENAPDPEEDLFFKQREQGYDNEPIGNGINSTRGVLCEALLRAGSRFWDEDVETALQSLADDPTITVRATLIYFLPYFIGKLGWPGCFDLFRRSFKPDEPDLMTAVPNFLTYVPRKHFSEAQPILEAMGRQSDEKTLEAWAILSACYCMRGWTQLSSIENILLGSDYPAGVQQKALEIVCRSAKVPSYLSRCLEVLEDIVKKGHLDLIAHVEMAFQFFRPDDIDDISDFISLYISRPGKRKGTYWLVEYLEKTLPHSPNKAFELLEELLASETEFESTEWYLSARASKAPLRIVNFILECRPGLETRALTALDQLIMLRWTGVEEYLKSIERL